MPSADNLSVLVPIGLQLQISSAYKLLDAVPDYIDSVATLFSQLLASIKLAFAANHGKQNPLRLV